MKIAVVACLHGDEIYGLEVGKRLPINFSFFIANKEAIRENKRFIDTDLNRCFPGKESGNNEEIIAYELINRLYGFDCVIDLHSTSNKCPLFGIITKVNKEKIELAKLLRLKKLVIMIPSYASGKALIDFVKCGISLEVGPHDRKQNVDEAVNAIKSLLKNDSKKDELKVYEVFDIIRGKVSKILINNFQEVKKGQTIAINKNGLKIQALFDFTAVLVGEKAYDNVLCLACKKISIEKIKNNQLLNTKVGKAVITPWEVSGNVDYEKLIKEFGVVEHEHK